MAIRGYRVEVDEEGNPILPGIRGGRRPVSKPDKPPDGLRRSRRRKSVRVERMETAHGDAPMGVASSYMVFGNMIEFDPSEDTRTAQPARDRADIVSILNAGDKQWVDYRGRRFREYLSERGIVHGWIPKESVENIRRVIGEISPRVVINEANAISTSDIRELAETYPQIKFVNLLHGSITWCMSMVTAETYSALRDSAEIPNVYFGAVSIPHGMAFPAHSKVIEIPNPIELPKGIQRRSLPPDTSQRLVVSLVARSYPIKNWGGMAAALAILTRRRWIKAVCIGQESHYLEHHFRFLRDLGVNASMTTFADWATTLQTLASDVHVGLACGFSDSLNLIAAEQCLMGIPVVGSPSTDWLPRSWQANPQDPGQMADIIDDHVSNYEKRSKRAIKIAGRMAEWNEIKLIAELRNLLK